MERDDLGRDVRNPRTRRPQNPEASSRAAVAGTDRADTPGARAHAAGDGGARGPQGAGDASDERQNAPTDPTAERPRRLSLLWKVIGGLLAAFAAVQLIATALGVVFLTIGLATCSASCSDNPTNDSREHAAFIKDRAANERDLEVFDALRGSLEALHKDSEKGVRALDVDDLRAKVAAGTWPTESSTDALSPQVWIRIAQLSQDWLCDQTGESWRVDDFAYPFPNNGPIPWPATRGEESRCLTRLVCTTGTDEGLNVTVGYYRWAKEAYFEADVEEARAARAEREALREQVEATDLLGERDTLLVDRDLYVWETGPDDELRDPETFLTWADELCGLLGDYADVTLLAADTPIKLSHSVLSSRYPNEHPLEDLSLAEARQRLLDAGSVYSFDHARGDTLLSCYRRKDEALTLDDLKGELAPTPQEEWHHPWRPPSEACVFDDELVSLTAELLGASEERIIVASSFDTSDARYDSMDLWVIMPRGVMPETAQAFCDEVDQLSSAYWERVPENDEKTVTLCVHLFVVDEETMTDATGAQATFAQMRATAQEWPADLEGYSFDLLLTTMPYLTKWPEDESVNGLGTGPSDVGGSISRTRSWRYDEP